MNWIDFLLLLIVVLAGWSGYKRGFILGSLELLSWVGSLAAAFLLYKYLAVFMQKTLPALGVWTMPLSFLLVLVILRILFSMLVNAILHRTHHDAHHSKANKALGILPGVVNGFIYAVIISALLLVLPLSDGLSAAARDSKVANEFGNQVAWLDDQLAPVFDEAVRRSMTKMTIESNEVVKLNFTVNNPKPRPDLEAQMLQMVNAERAKAGLPVLVPDTALTAVARAHSRDMFARGYFAHISPEGATPADRVRNAGIRYLITGENLALGPTLKICHTGLMNSPGHRANILHQSYGRAGIGILDGGLRGLMVTQEFRN
ncbi:MAG TPA: CvpA family protein [Chitinophagaceae bacterium]